VTKTAIGAARQTGRRASRGRWKLIGVSIAIGITALPLTLDSAGATAPAGAGTTTVPPAPSTTVAPSLTTVAPTSPPTTTGTTTVTTTLVPIPTTSPAPVTDPPSTSPPTVSATTVTVAPETSTTSLPTETTSTTLPVTLPPDPDSPDAPALLPDVREERTIVFPLVGPHQYGTAFNVCSVGCTRFHRGIDLVAAKLQPIVSPVDGVVVGALDHPAAGFGVVIHDSDGYEYRLYHLNNDSPNSDDGLEPGEWRVRNGLSVGSSVRAGELVGFVGDSGDAEESESRVHFEIRRPDGTPIDPSWSLDASVDDGWLCASPTDVTDDWIVAGGVAVSPRGFRPLDGTGCVEAPPSPTTEPPSTTVAPAPPADAADPPIIALVASAPGAPTVTVFGASVRVTFSPPASNGGEPITRYTATCASNNGGTTRSGSAGASPVNVYGLTLGRTYRCSVVATNADGHGPSSQLSAPFVAVGAPSAPRSLTALVTPSAGAGSGRVRLWWQAPTSNGGAPIVDYVVQRSTNGSAWTTVNDGTSTATFATATGLVNGRRYFFRVAARTSSRTGAWASPVSAIPRWVPGATRSPAVTVYGTSASVRFLPPTSNGGSAIIRYTATCTSNDGGVARSGSAGSAPVPVYGLTANRTYRCVVRATNAVGVGSASVPTAAFCAGAGCLPPGTIANWTNVTPANMRVSGGSCDSYGVTSVLVDPSRPSNLYAHSDCFGIWRSTNYGASWTGPINTGRNGSSAGNCAGGGVSIAPGSGSAPILYMSCIRGSVGFWRSVDGGVNWTRYTITPTSRQDYGRVSVDPYDRNHLIMTGHEFSGIVESTNGGQTWRSVNPPGNPGGGSSALFFVNTGTASTARTTWLYTAQVTGGTFGTWRTSNGGASWTRVESLEHGHGTMNLFQDSSGALFMAGSYGSSGHGVYRSTDYGRTWRRVGISMPGAVVWGTPSRVYTGYSWACGDCNVAANFQSAPAPGTSGWTRMTQPSAMAMGPAAVAVTFDGTRYIVITGNWRSGLWRYVEP
jgi:hypothetical protein